MTSSLASAWNAAGQQADRMALNRPMPLNAFLEALVAYRKKWIDPYQAAKSMGRPTRIFLTLERTLDGKAPLTLNKYAEALNIEIIAYAQEVAPCVEDIEEDEPDWDSPEWDSIED